MSLTSVFGQSPRQVLREQLNESYTFIDQRPDEAKEKVRKAYEAVSDSQDDYLKMLALSGMGYVDYRLRNYEEAYIHFSKAFFLSENLDTVDYQSQTSILQSLAAINSKFRNYSESIGYREKALKLAMEYIDRYPELAKKNNVPRLLRDLPYFIAIDYEKKGAHRTAGKILAELWNRAEDKNDIVSYARVLNKLGIIKKKNGEFNEAIKYFGKVVAAKEVSKKRKAIAYHNLGETYMDLGNYMKAENFYSIALGIKEDLGDKRSLFITHLYMGELAYKKGEIQKAIDTWENALNIFNKIDDEPELYAIYNWLQLAYMEIDVAKAKAFNNEFVSLVNFHNRNRDIQKAEEAEQREALSLLIDRENQKRVDAANQKEFIRQFWPIFLGVALLLIFSLYLGYRYYQALHANKLLRQGQLQTTAPSSDTSSTQKRHG